MKVVSIILFVITILINCTDNSDDNVKVYSGQELITKLSQEASKIVTKYNYEIKFGEPEQLPSSTSKSYFKNDSVLILRIDLRDSSEDTYLYKRANNDKLLSITYLRLNKGVGKTLYDYDDVGNLTKITSYNSKGEIENKSLYKYDSKSRLVEEFHYDSTGFLWLKEDFEYDSRGNKVKEIKLNNELKGLPTKTETEFKYDDRNLLIEEYMKIFSKESTSNWYLMSDYYTVHKYNRFNKVKEVFTKSPVKKHREVTQFDKRTLFNFNDDGKVAEEIQLLTVKGENEKITSRRVRSYNSIGEEIEFKYFNENGELVSYSKYEYEFPKRDIKAK